MERTYKPGNYFVLTKAEKEAYEEIRQAAKSLRDRTTTAGRNSSLGDLYNALDAFDALQTTKERDH